VCIARLLIREILHRKLNFLLGLLAVVAATALFVALLTMGRASERETARIMRNMGFNLLILPKDTEMNDFWASDFASGAMPEQFVQRLLEFAVAGKLSADHFVATLQKKVSWRNRKILLTGLLPELGQKSPMGFLMKPGTAYVGFELAQSLGIKRGEKITVLGKNFTVERCLGETGSKDDIRIYAHLHDVQVALGMQGEINSIQALGCRCRGDSLATIRKQLAEALPGTKVTEFRSIALARAETRKMVERHMAFVVPLVLLVCAAWVGVLALMNVFDRETEIGILRALGVDSGRIAGLFLGKAAIVGLVGAAIGFVLGTALARHFGPEIFKITFTRIQPSYHLLAWALVVAPMITTLASFLPTVVAVTQDPAVTLTKE